MCSMIYVYDNAAHQQQMERSKIKNSEGAFKGISFGTLLCDKKYRFMMLSGCGIQIMQQMTGVNILTFYSNDIFDDKTDSQSLKTFLTTCVGISKIPFILITYTFVDKYGRKIINIIGGIGMTISLCVVGIFSYFDTSIWSQFAAIITFILFFEASIGPLAQVLYLSWVYCSEIMIEKGAAVACFCNWFCVILIGVLFPFLKKGYMLHTYGAFWLFSGFNVLGLLFIIFLTIETKGLTREQIDTKIYNLDDENTSMMTISKA